MTRCRFITVVSCAMALIACHVGANSGGVDIDPPPPPPPEVCAESYLDYDNFGEPFIINWCRGCHSGELVGEAARQKAPPDINFDAIEDVRQWSARIAIRGAGSPATMPPAGGPSDEERGLLAEWLGCGGK